MCPDSVCVEDTLQKLLLQQLFETMRADILALEDGDILGAVTEDAGGLILFQHDGGPIDVNLQRIFFGDVQCATQFDG